MSIFYVGGKTHIYFRLIVPMILEVMVLSTWEGPTFSYAAKIYIFSLIW
jgi:hypothetical protein